MLHENILRIRDENALGNVYHELQLSFASVEVSVKEIIAQRVLQEVKLYNEKAADYKHSLVKPSQEEARLNGKHARAVRKIDAKKQIEIAIKAFQSNSFFLLVDDLQVEELEQKVIIQPDTLVSFVKLTPLVGG